jgi:hypothetical protein
MEINKQVTLTNQVPEEMTMNREEQVRMGAAKAKRRRQKTVMAKEAKAVRVVNRKHKKRI